MPELLQMEFYQSMQYFDIISSVSIKLLQFENKYKNKQSRNIITLIKMDKKIKKMTVYIRCSNCTKNIQASKYRVHMWQCAKTPNINPAIVSLCKSQLHMSQDLQLLLKDQGLEKQQTFPCMHYLDAHPTICPSLPVKCPYCQSLYYRNQIDKHYQCCQKKKNVNNLQLKQQKQDSLKKRVIQEQTHDPTLQQNIDYLMRDIFGILGLKNSRGLTNNQLLKIPKIIYRKSDNQENQQCSICVKDFWEGQSIAQLPCGHLYCKQCICHWFSRVNSCALCRKVFCQ